MILLVDAIDDSARSALNAWTLNSAQQEFVSGVSTDAGRAMRVAQLLAVAHLRGVDFASVAIASEPSGRPTMPGTNVQVSVSHTTSCLAVMLGERRIGVDVEELRSRDMDVLRRLFSAEEALAIVDDEDFTQAWVRKEAYAKWTGYGLGEHLATGSYETTVGSMKHGDLFVGYAGSARPPRLLKVTAGTLVMSARRSRSSGG